MEVWEVVCQFERVLGGTFIKVLTGPKNGSPLRTSKNNSSHKLDLSVCAISLKDAVKRGNSAP